jgi:hypothetical protein
MNEWMLFQSLHYNSDDQSINHNPSFSFFLSPFCHDNHTNLPYLVCHIHHSPYTIPNTPSKKY